MGSYVPHTLKEQEEMLQGAGYADFEDMLSCIPAEVRLKEPLPLPAGKSEMEVIRLLKEMAGKNVVFDKVFRGAGAYDHYIPSIVKQVTSKEEFITAYTPYQAEISQGILQSIFEYQTMMCRLTGLDVANASHYDGATAAAESLMMCKDRKHKTAYVSATVHPGVRQVMKTYCFANGTELVEIPEKDGLTDREALQKLLAQDEAAAVVYIQQPNFYGLFEEATAIGEMVHQGGAKFVMGVNPMALAVMKTPADCGADVAVGDGQPLGMPLAYGGPYLGFMTATEKMMRQMPGRIVGETKDAKGERAFVLTLQAREQHIRREKASSNICSNQALCALTTSVYLAAMGTKGLTAAAEQSMAKAHYLKEQLVAAGLTLKYDKPFFHEFVTHCPEGKMEIVLQALENHGILGGLPISESEILWCATEKNTKEDMDRVAAIVKAVMEGKEAH